MISKSLLSQTKARLIEFRREPSAMYWVIFMPIFWMVVLGFAFSNESVERYGIYLVSNGDQSAAVLALEKSLVDAQTIKLSRGDKGEGMRSLARGRSLLLLTLNESITLEFDPMNREAKIAAREVERIMQSARGRQDVIHPVIKPLTIPGQRYVDWLIPGLLGLSIMSTSLFGVGMTVVSNRKENVLKRLCATPLPKHEYILSHILGRFVSLAIETSAILLAGYFIFGFGVAGSMATFILFAVMGMICFTAIAMLCAAKTKSLPAISGVTNLLMIMMVMTSGVFFAKTNYPDWFLPILDLIPLTSLVDALRLISLEAVSFGEVMREFLILGAYTVVASALALKRFVWY